MSNRIIPMEISNDPQMIKSPNQGNQGYHLNNKALEPNSTSTYSTPLNGMLIFALTIIFIAGIGVLSFFIALTILDKDTSKLLYALIGLFFIIIGIIVGSCSSVNTTITVDYNLGIIIFKTRKICCCFSISKVIQINQIQKVIIKNDFNTTFKIKKHGRIHFAFDISCKLIDGNEVEGASGLMDRNHEGRKVFSFLKSTLPKNITFSGNLTRRKRGR